MAATRCIRCTKLLEGGGQFCDACQPSDPVVERGASSTISSMPTCPKCGRGLEGGTMFCDCQIVGAAQLNYGGFLIRLGAYLIDGIILSVFGLVVAAALSNAQDAFFLQIAAGAVYHIVFWVAEGATPGKMVFGLRVRNLDGSPISLGQAILRVVGYWISGLILGIGFLVILFNEEKRGLHDYMANTVVVVERD